MSRIAIDARMCAYRRGGIASYADHLATALAPVLRERGHTLIVGHARRGPPVLPPSPDVAQPTLFTPPHHRLEQWSLPLEWLRSRPDVLHSPDFLPVRPGPWRTVITVHDLDFVRHPDRLTPDAQRYYGRTPAAVRDADAVIAVSHATRSDLIALLDTDPSRITVIHEAADPRFRPPECAAEKPANSVSIETTRVPTPYFLAVGTVEPRKNYGVLLDAYAAYRASTADAPHLVVAGAEGWNSGEIVARLRAEPGVVWLDAVTPDDLVPLYHHALALLQPSWYEGFGLPVVEAMASGTPVAISDTPALVEVAGDSALVAPADDRAAWLAIMRELATNAPCGAELRARGLARAADFSWGRAARETADLYERVLTAPRRKRNGRARRAD